MSRKELEQTYFELGIQLEENYPKLSFRNHCYWRIALDQVFQNQWDLILQKPAYKNLTEHQLTAVIELLMAYKNNHDLLMTHNEQSLYYRK